MKRALTGRNLRAIPVPLLVDLPGRKVPPDQALAPSGPAQRNSTITFCESTIARIPAVRSGWRLLGLTCWGRAYRGDMFAYSFATGRRRHANIRQGPGDLMRLLKQRDRSSI